jgi:hypothetical protein
MKHFPGSERWVLNDFLLNKMFPEALSYQLKMLFKSLDLTMLKSSLNKALAFGKKTFALVNLWVISKYEKSLKREERIYTHETA